MNSGRDSDGDKFFSDLGGLVVFGDREPSEVAVPRLNEQDDDRKLAVEIARYPPQAPGEGFIESVGWREGHVEVAVLLDDGRDAMARLSAADWEWLEHAAGDIVPVRATGGPPLSA